MKLAYKLFVSYIVVILVGAVVISALASITAPVSFANNIQNMQSHMQNQGMHMGNMNSNGLNNAPLISDELEADLNESFRATLYQSLLISSLIAIFGASLISFYVSQRITQPIRLLAEASQSIADGHYDQTISLKSGDELGDLVQNFNSMAQTLNETETMRQRLIADVSHELKTPLASIQGYMEGLQDSIIPATSETYQQIHRETARLQRLVQDLQELSLVEAGQLKMDMQTCDLKLLVGTTTDWLRPQYEDKSIGIQVNLSDDEVAVSADYDRLRQVVLNLLGNALQYTPANANGQVTVNMYVAQNIAHIAIQDTGVGLSKDDIRHIFDRFYRVDKSRSRASGGSGIGLTIARHIITNLGGSLWAESAGLGQGSTFHFTLPLVQKS